MSDFRIQAYRFAELLSYRALERALQGKPVRATASRVIPVNPRADPRGVFEVARGGGAVEWEEFEPKGVSGCFREGGAAFMVGISGRAAVVTVYAPDAGTDARLDAVALRLAAFAPGEPEEVGVWAGFATLGKRCVEVHTRFVGCPTLESLRGNYPAGTFGEVEGLARDAAPWRLGKLVIWSGPPGTGKTHALRGLMHAWQRVFDPVVVNDPERFAEEPSYYFQLVGYAEHDFEEGGEEPRGPRSGSEKRPKLIVMEDAADLILLESRSTHYDKLGKLLNLTDGLFGQGRNDLFLVTFNEEISQIDPAFLRAGRCRSRIEFPKLSRPESEAWLDRHGLGGRARGETALADLYRSLHEQGRGR